MGINAVGIFKKTMRPLSKFFDLLSTFPAVVVCATGSVDADHRIEYFTVSNPRVRKNDTIVFKCGAALEQAQDGRPSTLVIQIRKWFPGSRQQWLLSSNEVVERTSLRYNATIKEIGQNQITEVQFIIKSTQLIT